MQVSVSGSLGTPLQLQLTDAAGRTAGERVRYVCVLCHMLTLSLLCQAASLHDECGLETAVRSSPDATLLLLCQRPMLYVGFSHRLAVHVLSCCAVLCYDVCSC